MPQEGMARLGHPLAVRRYGSVTAGVGRIALGSP